MILTLLPPALLSMSVLSFAALSSIEAEAGTEAVMISIPFAPRASVIPRQYCIAGRNFPASRSSSNPRSPWARTIGFLGVPWLISNDPPERMGRDAILVSYRSIIIFN